MVRLKEKITHDSRMKYNGVDSFGLLWFYLCGFYLTQITFVSPVYVAYVITFLYSLLIFSFNKNKHFPLSTFIVFIFCFFGFVLATYSPLSLSINYFISISSVLIVVVLFRNRSIKLYHFLFMLGMYSLLFGLDGIWRFINPDLTHIDKLEEIGVGFQIYKVNSFMYADSNFVGIQCVMFFSVLLYVFNNVEMSRKDTIFFKIIFLTLIFSTFMTFSRSAYLGIILSLLMNFLCNRERAFYIFCFFSPIFIFLGGYLVSDYFSNDISFSSKFHILQLTDEYLNNADLLTLLLGVGLGNAEMEIGMGAHNIIVSLMIETGILGLLFFIISNFIFLAKLGRYFFVICFPFLFSSLSLGTTAIPYFYTLSVFCILIKSGDLLVTTKSVKEC